MYNSIAFRYFLIVSMILSVFSNRHDASNVLSLDIEDEQGHTREHASENGFNPSVPGAELDNILHSLPKLNSSVKTSKQLLNLLQEKGILSNATTLSSFQNMMVKMASNSNVKSLKTVVEGLMSNLQTVLSPEALSSVDQCKADFSRYIHGVMKGEMWALKMLDASGKPGTSILQGALKFLGNYDECLGIKHTVTNSNGSRRHVIKGNYCHFSFSLPESLLNATTNIPFSLGVINLQWDLCLPMSCSDSQVSQVASKLPLNQTGISLVSAHFIKNKDWTQDKFAVATVIVLCVIVFLSVIGTGYDVMSAEVKSRRERRRSQVRDRVNEVFYRQSGHSNKNTLGNGTIENASENEVYVYTGRTEDDQLSDGFGRQLLLSFSLFKNTEKILNTSTGGSNLGCIHGIRVLSMAWVILGHSMTWDSMRSWINMVDYANMMRRFSMQFLTNGTLSVDTFFVLTGCLVTYLFLKECEKNSQGKPTIPQMVLYYVHRWWRLTPVYMIILLFYAGLLDYMIHGPLAEAKAILDPNNCRTNWWKNIIYINNFYEFKDMCFPVTWFLANDMQFYVIAPIALIPISFGIAWFGYSVMFLMLATHISMYGYLEWKYDGATQFQNAGPAMNLIYTAPWCRVGVFAIGMFLGAILHKTRCKPKIRRYGLLIGWQVFLAIGLLSSYITYDEFHDTDSTWSVNTRIIHETLYRPGWGLFVSWIIFVCCTGHGGFINSILSWSAWVPLGRLTYGAYLIHPTLLSYTEYSLPSLRYLDIPYLSYHFIGTFVVSYALSFITCVLVESPCMGLEKAVLKKLGMKK